MRPKYPAETTNFYRPPEVAVRPKHSKCKNEKRIRFSYFTFENEKRKTKKELVFRFSFANLKTKNEKPKLYPFFVRKFEKEKGKNGIYTDLESHINQETSRC